jgi:hypothetical protein
MKSDLLPRVVATFVLLLIAALISGVPESVVASYYWTHREQVSDSDCRALGGSPLFGRSDSVFFHMEGLECEITKPYLLAVPRAI